MQPIAPNPQTHLRLMGQLTADIFSNGQYLDGFATTTSATATMIGMFHA